MNYLGRNHTSCAVGLRDYHRAVRRLRQCATRHTEAWVAQDQLERLRFDVEVDVLSRSGPRATERMTEVEAVVFYPTLVRLNETLAGVAVIADPAGWQRPLDAALGGLRQAVRCLRRPPRACGAQCEPDWLDQGLDAEAQREDGTTLSQVEEVQTAAA